MKSSIFIQKPRARASPRIYRIKLPIITLFNLGGKA